MCSFSSKRWNPSKIGLEFRCQINIEAKSFGVCMWACRRRKGFPAAWALWILIKPKGGRNNLNRVYRVFRKCWRKSCNIWQFECHINLKIASTSAVWPSTVGSFARFCPTPSATAGNCQFWQNHVAKRQSSANNTMSNVQQTYNSHTVIDRIVWWIDLCFAFRRLSYYFSGCHSCPRYSSVQDIRSMEYLPEADADGSYINESERNVHVWCSIVKPCSYDSTKFTNKPTLGLIAGKFGICIRTYSVLLISRLLYTQRVAAGFRVV